MYDYMLEHGKINTAIKGGGFEDLEIISIEEPSMKNFNHIASLKNVIGKALSEVSKNTVTSSEQEEAKEDESKIDSKAMISILMMGGVYDLAVEQFVGFILKYAVVGDDTKLTKSLLDQMSPKDFENILGEYFADFLF